MCGEGERGFCFDLKGERSQKSDKKSAFGEGERGGSCFGLKTGKGAKKGREEKKWSEKGYGSTDRVISFTPKKDSSSFAIHRWMVERLLLDLCRLINVELGVL